MDEFKAIWAKTPTVSTDISEELRRARLRKVDDVATKLRRRLWFEAAAVVVLFAAILFAWQRGLIYNSRTVLWTYLKQTRPRLLGRPAVEGMLVPMGNGSAARNTPFLSTAEMFRMKEVDDGQAAFFSTPYCPTGSGCYAICGACIKTASHDLGG